MLTLGHVKPLLISAAIGAAVVIGIAISVRTCTHNPATQVTEGPPLPNGSSAVVTRAQTTLLPVAKATVAAAGALLSMFPEHRNPAPNNGSAAPQSSANFPFNLLPLLAQVPTLSVPTPRPTPLPTLQPTPTSTLLTPTSTPTSTLQPTPDPFGHTRLGVLVGPLPGVITLDVQVLRGQPLKPLADWSLLPPDVSTLEMSLDATVNHKALGLGVAAGDKVFVTVGAYGAYDLTTGLYAGVGLRF